MFHSHGWLILVPLTAIGIYGCSKPDGSEPRSETSQQRNTQQTASNSPQVDLDKLEAPAAATYEFLDAVRTGNDEKATKMLSTIAREKTAALNLNITPPASDTARFTLGKVEYIGQDGARVASLWTDVDKDGLTNSDEAIWVLRREEEGWRVVGVAATVFHGEP